MLIEVDSLDLMSTIAEFCVYCSGICIKFPSAFMSYDQVPSPFLLKTNQNTCIRMRTVCYHHAVFSI